ncbi:hypothetical protein Egran_03417 [Elaphomyces granulatus]|uniref:LPXTG-motif cell wall anchor domain protein n=1 Tax=Elaphomyces granulatus TaxID=519963 RepID=A0A232LXD2_9EURO|nr:hypothetical protein Egran_03417 [Elaphomyces granulatus]
MLTTLITPTKQAAEWARPRRQTDPNLVHRSSKTLQSIDSGRRSINSSPCAPGSKSKIAVPASSAPSVTTVSPFSPLSIRGLSNPALAEIPLRKFNALRSSTGSSESSPSTSASTLGSVLSTPTSVCELTASCPRDSTNHHDQHTLIQNDDQSQPSSAAEITTSSRAGPANKLGPNSNFSSLPKLHPSTSPAGFEPRSLHHKRPPASRSSHGIETSTGPPPALSTQRTFLQDKVLRTVGGLQPNLARQFSQKSSSATAESENLLSPSIDAVLKGDVSNRVATDRRVRQTSLHSRRGAATKVNGKMSSTSTYPEASTVDGEEEPTISIPNGLKVEKNSRDSSADDNRTRGEDIFLNIARSNASNRDSAGKADRRRKFGLSTRNSRASEQTPSPEQSRLNSGSASAFHTPGSSPLVSHNLLFPLPASSHPGDEPNRPRYFSVSTGPRSTVGAPRGRLNRAAREMSPESPQTYADLRPSPLDSRTYRPSNLSATRTNPPPPSSSDATERSRLDVDRARLDGTESTLSTTAPSTVWDELDDLKSRIRKLELTGKLPSSSAAAMSNASAERPRTATTTVTTLSSSPKHDRKANTPSPDSDIGPGPGPALASVPAPNPGTNQIETLLHTALAKVKTAVGTEAYNALEGTAADALTLANMLGSITSPSGAVNGVSLSERQARRKADSLCRGLTELCLALSDEQLSSASKQQRPGSRDATSHVKASNGSLGDSLAIPVTYRRSMSHESEDSGRPEPIPRVASRLEARRASLLNQGGSSGSRASQGTPSSPTTAALPTPPTRLGRLPASFRTKKRVEEDIDTKATVFGRVAPSRAMSEVGSFSTDQRYSPRERLSREYTPESQPQSRSSFSQKPQSQPHSPSVVPPSIPLRKGYGASASLLPATSCPIQPGSRRYGASAATAHATSDRPFNESWGERAESPQQQIPQPRTNKSVTRPNNSKIRFRQRAKEEG